MVQKKAGTGAQAKAGTVKNKALYKRLRNLGVSGQGIGAGREQQRQDFAQEGQPARRRGNLIR